MKTGYRLRIIFIALVIISMLSPISLAHGQPQGYTLIYSPPRAYDVDWMDVKAIYMKEEEDRLYFYVEYYGEIPSSSDHERVIYIYMDTDRNLQTGYAYGAHARGADCYIFFDLNGDNSHVYSALVKWNGTSKSWSPNNIKELEPNASARAIEIWVDKQDIGYTPNGINFFVWIKSYVIAMPEPTELSYFIGSLRKKIMIDGEPEDWDAIAPLKTFSSRSINPPELEVSSIYVANDDENLYVRFDTRGKPTTIVGEGELCRIFFISFDTDNNNITGCWFQGADFEVCASFCANPSKYTNVHYFKSRAGTESTDCYCDEISSLDSSDFNRVFELKIPLSMLNVSTEQTHVRPYIGAGFFFAREIPKAGYLTYPITEGWNVDRSFFEEVLQRLNIDLSDFALDALEAWKRYENTRAFWNPLATNKKMEGKWNTRFNFAFVFLHGQGAYVLDSKLEDRPNPDWDDYWNNPINHNYSGALKEEKTISLNSMSHVLSIQTYFHEKLE